MCFNQPMSTAFSILGFLAVIYAWYTTKKWKLCLGVFYFFLMEFLQALQYIWIDQPFFTHWIMYSLAITPKAKVVFTFLLKMCLLVGIFLASRLVLNYVPGFVFDNTDGFQIGYTETGELKGADTACGRSSEWIRGKELCTFSGRQHLGWSIPLATPTYFVPAVSVHFVMMFLPYLALKGGSWMYGVFLFLTGPGLAWYFTDDLMEQASIWCFFSIGQIICMLIGIRMVMNNPKYDEEVRKKSQEKDKES